MSHAKPLDAGTGRVAASFDAESGAWLSLGAPHAELGFVELSAVPRFAEANRGDPGATRRYRLELTRGEHAFLWVELDGARPQMAPDCRDPTRPAWRGDIAEAWVQAAPEGGHIRQLWALQSPRSTSVRLHLRGRVERPAFAEITDLDPPPRQAVTETSLQVHADAALLVGPGARATVRVSGAGVAWEHVEGGLVATLERPTASGPPSFAIEVGLEPLADPGPRDLRRSADAEPSGITARALAYVRGCTALRVGVDERAILTDHRLLPLSWTRDAYWQALLLLATDGPGDRERVADHLRWLWRRCERPDGRWVRSHYTNGGRKDLAFQADQQLYPIVELADYWRLAGSLPIGVDWERAVPIAWRAALEEIDSRAGLMATHENAADDPAALPFLAGSQILLWYTAHRLAELAEVAEVGDATSLVATADAVRRAFGRHLAARGRPWAYAVDALGSRLAYHDANDLPIAIAPLWGFCDADDAGWLATMEFAFSPENPAWFAGPRAGLGSLHTGGAWTLGDVQRWIWATVVGSAEAADAARARLDEVAFVDGMLPEAYTSPSEPPVRHWFAWPGAAFGALDTLDRSDRLNELAVR